MSATLTPPYHTPVLGPESLALLVTDPKGLYIDCTYGGGGHSRGLLERLAPQGCVLAFDQDPDAYANRLPDPRLTLLPVNFRFLGRELERLAAGPVTGILADLGVSSHQFDSPERGFSFRFESPLDMRMAQGASLATAGERPTAAELLATYPEEALYRVFSRYGEFTGASRLARAVVAQRSRSPIETTGQLVALVEKTLASRNNAALLAQVFQALRIEVNDELGALEELLATAPQVLASGGRLVVLSYHSLEDRLVKNLLSSGNLQGVPETDFYGRRLNPWQALTKKPIVPSAQEVEINPRARSAKLRAAAYQPNVTP